MNDLIKIKGNQKKTDRKKQRKNEKTFKRIIKIVKRDTKK